MFLGLGAPTELENLSEPAAIHIPPPPGAEVSFTGVEYRSQVIADFPSRPGRGHPSRYYLALHTTGFGNAQPKTFKKNRAARAGWDRRAPAYPARLGSGARYSRCGLVRRWFGARQCLVRPAGRDAADAWLDRTQRPPYPTRMKRELRVAARDFGLTTR
jgi:hypothetical protein